MLLLVVVSTIASSEGVTDDVVESRAALVAGPLVDHASLLQLPSYAAELKPGRDEASLAIDLFESDAQAVVLDVTSNDNSAAEAAAAAGAGISSILPSSTKPSSTIASATCSYTVTIKTSCYSPRTTHDVISLTFSDAYGNQVYASRLDDPSSGTFERCSTDTFMVQGACGYKTCFLYMRRSGRDGWAPDWVRVASPYTRQAVTFYYNGYTLPNNVWYGFDQCSLSSGGGGGAGIASWWIVMGVVVSVLLVLIPEPATSLYGVDVF